MIIPDVNILIRAHRPDTPRHGEFRHWLEAALNGAAPVGIPNLVLSGFIRVSTHPRVFEDPTSLGDALAFCEAVRRAPSAVPLNPGPRHWRIFQALCAEAEARGNLVPDAYLAAIAIENSAEWISSDRDFARFPGLRWRHPLDAPRVS